MHCVERVVPVQVDVDLGSAAVAYRPAAGEERSSPVQQVSSSELFRAAPWRTFRWYFGQRHYLGTYWSSTQHDHVIYESRLELATLLFADYDPVVGRIVAQPFVLRADVDGQSRKHIPDYLWGTSDGPVVVDVVRAEGWRIQRLSCSAGGHVKSSSRWVGHTESALSHRRSSRRTCVFLPAIGADG